jgi:hypothetical protein
MRERQLRKLIAIYAKPVLITMKDLPDSKGSVACASGGGSGHAGSGGGSGSAAVAAGATKPKGKGTAATRIPLAAVPSDANVWSNEEKLVLQHAYAYQRKAGLKVGPTFWKAVAAFMLPTRPSATPKTCEAEFMDISEFNEPVYGALPSLPANTP